MTGADGLAGSVSWFRFVPHGRVAAFFGIMVMFALGKASSGDTVMVVLATTMASAFGALVNYYFGSSIGSKAKTDLLAAGLPPAKRVR